MAILVLPIMDTDAAIIRRKLTGRGLAIADRGHLHHVLQRNGLSIRRSLILVAVLGGIAAGGALFSTYLNNDLFALCSAASVVLILFMGGLFGNAEFRLVRERTVAVLKRATGRRPHIETAVRLQGDAAWDDVWKEVTACAEQLNLQTVCLDVNAPSWHEDYHVRWDRTGPGVPAIYLWRAEIPLFGEGQAIGRLTVCGPRDDSSLFEKLQILSKIVETAEQQAASLSPSSKSGRMTAPAGSAPVVASHSAA
jgi:UDP-GlcNAc:undecaprenyl-phosphate GlcNAc-1-phosphate transferase